MSPKKKQEEKQPEQPIFDETSPMGKELIAIDAINKILSDFSEKPKKRIIGALIF